MTELGSVLPTGTVTFMLTDIVGSTRTWESDEAAAGAAVARHYELLDEVISPPRRVRPLEQGEGDSTVAVFGLVADAVAAALDAQVAFDTEPWPGGLHISIRLAIHTGEAQFRDRAQLHGACRHPHRSSARRRRSGAGPAVGDDRRARSSTTSRPVRTWSIWASTGWPTSTVTSTSGNSITRRSTDRSPRCTRSTRSATTCRHQLTPLIGRTTEVAELVDALRADRLVTLTGSGGIGKTRLAHAVALELIDSFAGGVWWTDLAVVSDAAAVPSAVLTGCGGREDPGSTVTAKLIAHLGERPVLLVLDNCEHLAHPVADLVGELLAARPLITVLATSREPLGVAAR